MITVKELIARLRRCPEDAVVALSDWQEQYSPASEKAAEQPLVVLEGDLVILGEWADERNLTQAVIKEIEGLTG